MTVENFSISNEKVKLRYKERYLTEGSNEKSLALARGCYRGFLPRKSAVADMQIWLAVDPLSLGFDEDSFAIYSERNDGAPNYDGWSVSIREVADVALNLSGSALDPIPLGVTYLYVYTVANYVPVSVTTATYDVADEDPSNIASSNYNPDAILIGRIPVTPGAVVIDFDITNPVVYADVVAARKLPTPTPVNDASTLTSGDDLWGYIDSVSLWAVPTVDQKDALDGASSPNAANPFATMDDVARKYFAEPAMQNTTIFNITPGQKVPLSGRWYIGDGGIGDAARYFNLTDNDSNGTAAFGDGGVVYVGIVYNTAGTSILNPSVDADAQGFYNNPQIYIVSESSVAASSSISINVYGYKRAQLTTIDQTPVQALPTTRVTHTQMVRPPEFSNPPAWFQTNNPDYGNLTRGLELLHKRNRGPAHPLWTDSKVSGRLIDSDDVPDGCMTNEGYYPVGFGSFRHVTSARDDEGNVIVYMAEALGGSYSACYNIVEFFDQTKTAVVYDIATILPAASVGWWYITGMCCDNNRLYIRVRDTDFIGTADHYVFCFNIGSAGGLTLNSSWPAAGLYIDTYAGPPNVTHPDSDDIILAAPGKLATVNGDNDLQAAAPSTAGVVIIDASNGTILTQGCGDIGSLGLGTPVYACGPLVSTGEDSVPYSVYYGLYSSVAGEFVGVHGVKISDATTSWKTSWWAPVNTPSNLASAHVASMVWDGMYLNIVMTDFVVPGALARTWVQMPSVRQNGPVLTDIYAIDTSANLDMMLGPAGYDGKNSWIVYWDDDTAEVKLHKLSHQRINAEMSGLGGSWIQPYSELKKDQASWMWPYSYSAGDVLFWWQNRAHFDGMNLWYAPEWEPGELWAGVLFKLSLLKSR